MIMIRIRKTCTALISLLLLQLVFFGANAMGASGDASPCCDDPAAAAGSSCGCGCTPAGDTAASACSTNSSSSVVQWVLLLISALMAASVLSIVVVYGKRIKSMKQFRVK